MMSPAEFVELLKRFMRDTDLQTVKKLLLAPPGRKPCPKFVRLSKWYLSLDDADRSMAMEVVEVAVDTSLISLLSILDGVRAVEERSTRGRFELVHVSHDGVRTVINDRRQVVLNQMYRANFD